MTTRRIFLPTLLLSLVLAVALAYLAGRPAELRARTTDKDAPRPGAMISFVAGDVEVRFGAGPWRSARRGQTLTPGTTIRTGANGRAELILRKMVGRLRLDRNTRFALRQDGLAVSGRVESGSVWTELGQNRSGDPAFALGTGDVTATASNATYRVHAVRPDSVRVSVYRGQTTVAGHKPGDGTALHAEGQELSAGQALAVFQGNRYRLEEVGLDEDWSDGWLRLEGTAPLEYGAGTARKTAGPIAPLREELTDISPDIYVSVQLELTGTKAKTAALRPEQVQIRRIRIRSRQWDSLEPAMKVDLLNDTFSLLKGRYPGMLHSVVLEFDDGRPDLALKYGSAAG
jgi:hypothetical protein